MKVALLLSGTLRCYEYTGWNVFSKLAKPFNADVFCYFAQNSSNNTSIHGNEDIILKDIFGENLKKYELTGDSYKEIYIPFYEKCKNNLESYQPDLNINIRYYDKEKKIPLISKLVDQYVRVYKCCELMELYEKDNNLKYDMVIRGRIDLLYDDVFNKLFDYTQVYFCSPWNYSYDNGQPYPIYLIDCFFFGNRDYIVKICKEFISKFGSYRLNRIIDDYEVTVLPEVQIALFIKNESIPINFINYSGKPINHPLIRYKFTLN